MTYKNYIKNVGFASFIMMMSVFASRIIGIFREIAIAGTHGIKADVDAYQIAFVLPEILNHIVASGFLSITFIPIFTSYLLSNNKNEGYKIFSIILNSFGSFLIVCIFISMIFAPLLVKILAPGITDITTFESAVKMTRIIIPAQFFFFYGGLLMAIQFAHEKFFIPALAPLIYNLSIICGGLFLSPFIGIEGFAWGALFGAFFGNFLLQYIAAKKLDMKYYPCLVFNHPALLKYIKLTLPLMFGLTMTFSVEIIMKFFGSYLDKGSIAAMNYALRIMFILVGLFGQAIGVASYPFMAKLAQNNDLSSLNELLNTTMKLIFFVIPFSILFIVLRYEIVLMLFQRGQFDANASFVTAQILPFFMIGAFAFAAQNIVSRGYYAIQNTIFPVVCTSICVVLSLPIIFLFMQAFKAIGIAAGISITIFIQCFILFEFWSKKSLNIEKNKVYVFFLQIILISLLIGVILFATHFGLKNIIDNKSFYGSFVIAFLITIEFLFVFFLSGHIFKNKEIQFLYNNTLKKILYYGKKNPIDSSKN